MDSKMLPIRYTKPNNCKDLTSSLSRRAHSYEKLPKKMKLKRDAISSQNLKPADKAEKKINE